MSTVYSNNAVEKMIHDWHIEGDHKMSNTLEELLVYRRGSSKPSAWSYEEHVWSAGLGNYVWREKLESEEPDASSENIRNIKPLYDYTKVAAEGMVLVPERLTAENGAKYALAGEFYVSTRGRAVPIPWDTIKEIHKKMVEHFKEESNHGYSS